MNNKTLSTLAVELQACLDNAGQFNDVMLTNFTARALIPMLKDVERDIRCAALEEAARAVEFLPTCPFDKGGAVAEGLLKIEPHEPCPVCGDRGLFPDDIKHCRSPAVVIRALKDKAPGERRKP
jgi:hypothetical protein